VAADHRVVLADDEAVRIVSPALPGHVRVASPSGRPQLHDRAKCAAPHAPRNNLLMKIIPDSGCLPARAGGASSGTRPARHDRRPSRDCWVHPRLSMPTEPDVTSLYRTCPPAQRWSSGRSQTYAPGRSPPPWAADRPLDRRCPDPCCRSETDDETGDQAHPWDGPSSSVRPPEAGIRAVQIGVGGFPTSLCPERAGR
jgi:hypothetical protein